MYFIVRITGQKHIGRCQPTPAKTHLPPCKMVFWAVSGPTPPKTHSLTLSKMHRGHECFGLCRARHRPKRTAWHRPKRTNVHERFVRCRAQDAQNAHDIWMFCELRDSSLIVSLKTEEDNTCVDFSKNKFPKASGKLPIQSVISPTHFLERFRWKWFWKYHTYLSLTIWVAKYDCKLLRSTKDTLKIEQLRWTYRDSKES